MERSLTKKRIESALRKPGAHYRDAGPNGVPGVVNKRNASWQLRYWSGGGDGVKSREHWYGIGPLWLVDTVEKARALARAAREQLRAGVDPIAARRAEKAALAASAAAMTFRTAAEAYYEQHAAKWSNARHRDQFLNSLRDFAFPIIGTMPLASIGVPEVLRVLEQKVEADRGLPAGRFWDVRAVTASRVRGRIESVLAWATIRGHRPKGDNPARWKGHLDQAGLPTRGETTLTPDGQVEKVVKHHAALSYTEVPTLMAALRNREGVAALALQFLVLTGLRTREVLGAKWSEVDLESGTWTVPATRMKARKAHRVPLSSTAVELLRSCYREPKNPFIFIGPKSGRLADTALAAQLSRMGVAGTAHGFRSSFRTWAGERTSYPTHVIEMCLAHAVGAPPTWRATSLGVC